MKTWPITSILALLILFTSCGPNISPDPIVGEWKYVRLEMPAAAGEDALSADEMRELSILVSSFTMEFFSDKTFRTSTEGSEDAYSEGKYELLGDGTYLRTIETTETGPFSARPEILLLTADSLKLAPEDKAVIVFSRVK